ENIIAKAILEDSEVSKYLKDVELFLYDEADSTNELAKKYGDANPGKEAIFIADYQSKGKGRRGRSFYSPKGTGMYMSFLTRPDVKLEEAMNFTCMIAESTCRAIEKVTGINPGIKWVNDIYYNEKKISGILTEASTSLEDGSLSYVVIGIGINLYEPYEGFPDDIKDKAGALIASRKDPNLKNKLYSAMITEFYKDYKLPDKYPYLKGYRDRSFLIGSYVKITPNLQNEKLQARYAYVTGINDKCELLVKYDDGREEALFSGEVSVVKY
ncbi:MAG: biotin--[acetyl-CoA-carboxylase] ligase, partial [Lachnospiraceae bacterium]|nr:biotin--[acetyl-CoA-carboxylase] ligase [Lachnospiraceae bacterium]